jgi:hypothetical protein
LKKISTIENSLTRLPLAIQDWDYYLECSVCGRLTPKETARVESDISDVVEKNDSNSDGYAISLDDPRLSRRIREYHFLEGYE